MKIIIFTAIIILSNCEVFEPIWTDKNQKKRDKDFGTLIMWASITGGPQTKTEVEITDNKNGSLYYTYTKRLVNWPGNPVQEKKTILIQRCMIGQVYRPAENDCRGNGTKGTRWSALELQWCPVNDQSCEKDGLADTANSPAAKACSDSNFLGKNWGLGSYTYNFPEYLDKIPYEVIQDYSTIDDIRYMSIQFWLKESDSITRALYAGRGSYSKTSAIKSITQNVICIGDVK